jgi:hypothetical protein
MPLSRLSEIDLAKAMSLPEGPVLEAAMRSYNTGGGAWSYDPTRASTSDLVGAHTPLVGPLPPVAWTDLEGQIGAACTRGRDQEASNLQVSKLLFDHARQSAWSAVQVPMGRLSVGFGETVRYWSDVVIEDANGPFIPFFDHRRGGGLTSPLVRHIVYSMQFIGVQERNPDLTEFRLAVVRFPASGDKRRVQLNFHDGSELLSYEELDRRVRAVYATWAQVSDERTKKRRASGGGFTPFGF